MEGFSEKNLPRLPFLPQETLRGPAFLDTGACLCALQNPRSEDAKNTAWQCIGNQTQGVYTVDTGKWFDDVGDSPNINGTIEDGSGRPDTNKTLAMVDRKLEQQAPNSARFSIYDRACTGKNHSTYSTSYYRVVEAMSRNETVVDAFPCWRPGAIPVQIQSAESWTSEGCQEGFYCKFKAGDLVCGTVF
jgi:hypothetical protein